MTSVWPEIHSIPVGEHPLAWVAQKTRKTCFSRRTNNSSYQPKTNTVGLYDGSTEAKLIVMEVLKTYTPQEGLPEEQELTVEPMGVLHHVLDYLKGRDVPLLGMWTRAIMEPMDNCEKCKGERGGVWGNENVMPDGRILCDYCTADELIPVIRELAPEATKADIQERLIQIEPVNS